LPLNNPNKNQIFPTIPKESQVPAERNEESYNAELQKASQGYTKSLGAKWQAEERSLVQSQEGSEDFGAEVEKMRNAPLILNFKGPSKSGS
jgi:hypothetical protein